ncbi:hypothetical protein ME7_01286 [Bartonella birtlesii LL-WM9]|uniref:DUF1460 domain-containing protein n=1 Tax=Bartonella birtlesii LL-WM9 TaxID=1094552 RepID=J1IUV6_9HYPH|nr:hypothetical protein ME7_01286 [Bartonella birtlesii LL-WM9]
MLYKISKIFFLILILTLVTKWDIRASDINKDTLKNKGAIQQTTKVNLDPYTLHKLNDLLKKRSKAPHYEKGKMIGLLSEAFLETPYQANMLHGSENTAEKLIINFRSLDCFTYLEYVEALRKSTSQTEFIKNIIRTRYINGHVSFLNRKHFFTDWAYRKYKLATDITSQISTHIISTEKYLNKKANGGNYLPGLPVVKRTISYIPSRFINEELIKHLKTGDFIGIYSNFPGLDVSHVGFFIMTDHGPVLRNASSRKENEKVIDSPFMDYATKIPGIIVLRVLQ